jgi:SAM-dependent methyltransferase
MAIPCPACQANESAVFVAAPRDLEYFTARSVPAAVMRCRECRSLFQDPWPSAAEVRQFYGPDYQNYTSCSVPLLSRIDAAYQQRQGAGFLDRYGRDAAVLDFGCGQAGFLRVLARLGCTRLAGFDFVLYPELRETPSTRFYDDVDAILESGQRFDVIRMRHVIEHLTDADNTMRKLRSLLSPGGRIIGETPNAAHYTSALMGKYWGCLHFPYHTLILSTRGLQRAARRWDLHLVETAGVLLPTGWAMSFENMFKAWTRSRKRGRTPIYTLLMAGSMPMALLDRFLQSRATANFSFVLTART